MIYDSDDLNFRYEEILAVKPELMRALWDELLIVGKNEDSKYSLASLNINEKKLDFVNKLGNLAANPRELYRIQNHVYLLSSPLDTAISLTSFDTNSKTLTEKIILSNSGAVCTDMFFSSNDFAIHPRTNLIGIKANQKLFRYYMDIKKWNVYYDFETNFNVIDINAGQDFVGNEPMIAAKWNNGINDTVYFISYDNEPNWKISDVANGYPFRFVSYVQCTSSIRENLLTDEVHIHPNPMKNELFFKFTKETNELKGTYQLLNYSGQIILKGSIISKEGSILVKHIPAGIYFLKLITDEIIISKKIIKTSD